jgi:hypothetical protein
MSVLGVKDIIVGKIQYQLILAAAILFLGLSIFLGFKWIWTREALTIANDKVNKTALALTTCEGNYTGLSDELVVLKESVKKIQEENTALRDAIVLSSATSSRISKELNSRLQILKSQNAGSTCEERFQWLRDKARENQK